MKVKELKQLLQTVPDNLDVVVSGKDHSYFIVGNRSAVIKAELHNGYKSNQLTQYWNEDTKTNQANQVIEVFWIDDGRY